MNDDSWQATTIAPWYQEQVEREAPEGCVFAGWQHDLSGGLFPSYLRLLTCSGCGASFTGDTTTCPECGLKNDIDLAAEQG